MKPVASPGWGQHRTVATDSHSHRGLPSSSIRTCLSEGVHSFGRSPCLRSIIMSLTAGFRTMATQHISASNNAYEQSAAVHAVGTHFSAASTNRTNGRVVPSCHHTHMPHLRFGNFYCLRMTIWFQCDFIKSQKTTDDYIPYDTVGLEWREIMKIAQFNIDSINLQNERSPCTSRELTVQRHEDDRC